MMGARGNYNGAGTKLKPFWQRFNKSASVKRLGIMSGHAMAKTLLAKGVAMCQWK